MPRLQAMVVAALVAACCVPAAAPVAAAPSADARFESLSRSYLNGWLRRNPHLATELGLHAYDNMLRPVTQATMAQDAEWYRRLRDRLHAIPRAALSFENALEYDLLSARLDALVLELEVVQPQRRDPGYYLDLIAGSILTVLERDYASPCHRVQVATARLRLVPEVLRAARINLDRPDRLATSSAIGRYRGVLVLYRATVPELVGRCRDARAQAALAAADSTAIRAVEGFVHVLEHDLLPRARDRFAIGEDAYRRMLRAEEMVDDPLDSLLARGRREIARDRARADSLADRIAPGGGIAAALDTMRSDHPRAGALVPFVKHEVDHVRFFLVTHQVLTLPAREHLIVRETPAYRQGTSFASLEAPGVWEPRADEAFFDVSGPDPRWPSARRRERLEFFNRWSTYFLAIHEALPGHYYQALATRRVSSRLRQVLASESDTEGWAHYCEQMMLEQGFGGGDPRAALAQTMLALQRLGRLVAGISLHARGMTLEEARRMFERDCLLSPDDARSEAGRAALEPMVPAYTLGRWRILALRDEVRAALGPRFDLAAFHDALLSQGPVALPVARLGVLHDLGIAARGDPR